MSLLSTNPLLSINLLLVIPNTPDTIDYLESEGRICKSYADYERKLLNKWLYPWLLIRHIWLRLFG